MSEGPPETTDLEGQLVEAQQAAPPEAGELGVTGAGPLRPRPSP